MLLDFSVLTDQIYLDLTRLYTRYIGRISLSGAMTEYDTRD